MARAFHELDNGNAKNAGLSSHDGLAHEDAPILRSANG